MRFVYRGILGCAAAAGLIAAYGCGSDIEDDPPATGGSAGTAAGAGGGGAGGTGGASGSGGSGYTKYECTPEAEICYGNKAFGGPGSECMANIDNTDADVVQFRQTWSRVSSPVGNTTDTVYGVLRARAMLALPDCHMRAGAGGYIQISRWDRSNKTDLTAQTITTGYASYSALPMGAQPAQAAVNDGLCFIDWEYSYNGPALPTEVNTTGWPEALPQPWKIKPVVSKRVMTDWTDTAEVKAQVTEEYAGVVYIDEAKGYIHGYSPLSYVTVLDNSAGGLATPIREVDIKSQFNDSSFNCMGRFRADKMQLATNCDTGLDQSNPQWGCKDDAACPPTGIGESGDTGGLGPGYTTGYFLIVDLERVYSQTLASTLCCSYPGDAKSAADGWCKPTTEPGGWGKNCRGSPKWNPQAPNDEGLPMGDWCSRTNSPATATCHDAYRSRSYSAAQAFKVKEATKTDMTNFSGTCDTL